MSILQSTLGYGFNGGGAIPQQQASQQFNYGALAGYNPASNVNIMQGQAWAEGQARLANQPQQQLGLVSGLPTASALADYENRQAAAAQQAYMEQYQAQINKQQNEQAAQAKAAGQTAGQLFDQYSTAYKNARNANEQRFGEITAGYRGRYQQAQDTLNQFSNQDRNDVNSTYDRLSAKTTRSAMDRGLGNTTVVDSLQRGVESDRTADLRRVNDADAQRRLGTEAGMSKETLDFLERRQDEYPDLNTLTNLAMQAGSQGVKTDPSKAFGGASGAYQGAFAQGTQANSAIYGAQGGQGGQAGQYAQQGSQYVRGGNGNGATPTYDPMNTANPYGQPATYGAQPNQAAQTSGARLSPAFDRANGNPNGTGVSVAGPGYTSPDSTGNYYSGQASTVSRQGAPVQPQAMPTTYQNNMGQQVPFTPSQIQTGQDYAGRNQPTATGATPNSSFLNSNMGQQGAYTDAGYNTFAPTSNPMLSSPMYTPNKALTNMGLTQDQYNTRALGYNANAAANNYYGGGGALAGTGGSYVKNATGGRDFINNRLKSNPNLAGYGVM